MAASFGAGAFGTLIAYIEQTPLLLLMRPLELIIQLQGQHRSTDYYIIPISTSTIFNSIGNSNSDFDYPTYAHRLHVYKRFEGCVEVLSLAKPSLGSRPHIMMSSSSSPNPLPRKPQSTALGSRPLELPASDPRTGCNHFGDICNYKHHTLSTNYHVDHAGHAPRPRRTDQQSSATYNSTEVNPFT